MADRHSDVGFDNTGTHFERDLVEGDFAAQPAGDGWTRRRIITFDTVFSQTGPFVEVARATGFTDGLLQFVTPTACVLCGFPLVAVAGHCILAIASQAARIARATGLAEVVWRGLHGKTPAAGVGCLSAANRRLASQAAHVNVDTTGTASGVRRVEQRRASTALVLLGWIVATNGIDAIANPASVVAADTAGRIEDLWQGVAATAAVCPGFTDVTGTDGVSCLALPLAGVASTAGRS